MMLRCFQFIPEGIKDNGLFAQIATPVLPTIRYSIAGTVILMHIETVIILMLNVILAIQREQPGKINL
jgi:hypothetical protein